MAALPENYVSLLQLRERWHKRQQEAKESAPLNTWTRQERCEGNDWKRSTDGRKPVSLSGKGREKEEHIAGDIADRRWGKNKDGGGGEGRGRRWMAVPVAEGSAREHRCTGRSESEVISCAATSKDGWKLPREKEIVESSCFASAVDEDSNGKEVKRGDCRPKSSDRRQRSFKRSDSGPSRAKEDDAGGNRPRPFGRNDAGGNRPRPFGRNDAGGNRPRPFGRNDAGGNWPRPFRRNDAGCKDDGGSPRELPAFAEESGALERPSTRRSDPAVRLEALKSTIPPVDSEDIIRSAIVEDSGGKEAKSEVFHKKRDKSKRKSNWTNKKDAGVVGAEEGQGGGNWQRRPLKSNEDADTGDGISRRDVVASVAEIVALGLRLPRRFESEVSSCAATSKDGWKLPREKEIVESSCFTSAVDEDINGKEVKRGDCRPKSCDQRQRSFKRSDSGPARAKEDDAGGNRPRPFGRNDAGGNRPRPFGRNDAGGNRPRPFGRNDAGGNWPRPFGRNDTGCKDDGGSPRELAALAKESGALERPSTRRSDPAVRLEAQKSTIPPVDSGDIIRSAIVEDSDGKEAKSEVFHKKIDKSKRKSHWKNKKDAGVVGAEEGQGGGNWQRRPLKSNEDADTGDGISRREVVASVSEIVALGPHLPRRSDSEVVSGDHMPTSVPYVLESPPPEKELVRSVCFTGTVVEESSAKEEKRSNKERKKPNAFRGKDDEDRLENMAEYVHDALAEAVKEECRGNEMNNVDYLKRSNNCQQKGFKKTKSGMARLREEEEQVGKLADGHNLPLEAVTLPGGNDTERVASMVNSLEVNGSGNGRRVIYGPRNNRFSCRERIVVGEDNETQKDFSGDKVAINEEVEPANKYSRTEGKLGEKQKNGISSKEMVFCSDEGDVMRRLRDFSIGSSRRRGGRERRLPPRAENSRSWSLGNSGRKNGVSASYMDRDMVWVKKGDILSGNNKDDVAQVH